MLYYGLPFTTVETKGEVHVKFKGGNKSSFIARKQQYTLTIHSMNYGSWKYPLNYIFRKKIP